MQSPTFAGRPLLLQALAAAWLASGATSFSLWQGPGKDGQSETLLACWPAELPPQPAGLTGHIADEAGTRLGELRVSGVQGDAALARLQTDAALLASLATLEGEVESLTDALAETEDQLLALYELNKADPGRLDIDRLLQSLVRQAMRLVKADAAFAVLAPDRVACSSPPLAPEQSLIELFERARTAGGELLLRGADLSFGAPDGEGNLFIAPLTFRERPEIVAALGLWLNRPAAALSPDLKLARSIAEQAGAQLEIARLHEQLVAQARLQAEMELARTVQLDLLPRRSPIVAGLDVYGVSRPALQVGGDFFDYFIPSRAAGRPFTFAVGDVSGKGLSAALLMAMTRTNLRGSALRADNSTPATILAQANEDLYDDFTEVGMMATAFVGQYDPAAGKLIVANAGHSPVILCPAGGPARLLEADGPAMGVLPISLSQDEAIPFHPGDLLVVATDGFNEERDSLGELFGIDRLLRQVELLAADSPKAIADGLLAAVAQFTADDPQDDDQTIVVLKGRL